MATLEAQSYPGVSGGMNVAIPAHEIDDTEAYYLQDVLLDYPGLIRQRGPVTPASGYPTFSEKGSGIVGTLNPVGAYRIGVLTGDNSNGYFRMLSDDFSTYTTFTWTGALPTSPPNYPYRIVDSKPLLGGGVTIGTSSQYDNNSPVQNLAFWNGGNDPTYSTGTMSVTRGSATVTGSGTSWINNASSGAYLFGTVNDSSAGKFTLTFIGTIKSVDSDTSLTLTAPSPYTSASNAYEIRPVRGFQYKIMKGRITCSTGSTTVTGSNTKFIAQDMDEVVFSSSGTTSSSAATITGLSSTDSLKVGMRVSGTGVAANSYISSIDSPTQITMNQNGTANATNTITFKHMWNFYKASDLTWVGRLGTVNNEISVTLAANAAVALTEERFVALCGTGDWNPNTLVNEHKVGFLSAFYAGRQWYANNGQRVELGSRVYFSDPNDPEGVDLAEYDGDYISITSTVGTDTPIKALIPAYNGLVVIKESETFVITGNSPSSFAMKKIQDDGVLCGMAAQAYGGGVVWAGRDGIYSYDGVTVNNISAERLGDYYKSALRLTDPTKHRIWSAIARNHMFIFMEEFNPTIPVIKGTLPSTPEALTIVLNLETGAYTFFTNTNIRGFIETPAATGKQVVVLVNDATKAVLCNAFNLFDSTGRDTVLQDDGLSCGYFRYGEVELGTATAFDAEADTVYASKITVGSRSRVVSARVYSIGDTAGTSGTTNTRVGLYSDNSGVPDALLGTSSEVSIDQTELGSWREYTFTSPFEIDPGDYWIFVQVETSDKIRLFRLAESSVGLLTDTDTYSGGLDATYGATGQALSNGPLIAYLKVQTSGPDVFIESKKLSMGDPMRKKLFKQLAATYMVTGDAMRLDTVPSMNVIGKTSLSPFNLTAITWDQLGTQFATWDALAEYYPTWDTVILTNFKVKRIKFSKRSQLLSFRLWQNTPGVTKFILGPFQVAYKWQRIGRV